MSKDNDVELKSSSSEKEPEIIDLSKEPIVEDSNSPTTVAWHPEKARMTLAYCVLIAILIIFIISIGCSFLA